MDWIRSIFANSAPPLELLIYFVVVVLWVLGQFSQRKKRNERRRQQREGRETEAPVPSSEIERELREMMRNLTGEDEEPEPPRPPPPPPPPVRTRRRIPTAPPPRLADVQPALASTPSAAELGVMPSYAAIEDIKDISEATLDTISTQKMFTGTLNNIGFKFAINSMTIPAISQAMSMHSKSEGKRSVIRKSTIASRGKLREAIALRTVLGPPKALETTPWMD